MKSAQTRQVRAPGVPEVTRACVRKRRLRYAGVAGERDRRLRWRGERFGGGTAAPPHTSTGTARARTSLRSSLSSAPRRTGVAYHANGGRRVDRRVRPGVNTPVAEVMMTMRSVSTVLAALSLAALGSVQANTQPPQVAIPQPGVPQIMTLEAKFVRVAYNTEGYVIMGYQIANRTIGDEWIMLDVGITQMEKVRDYTLKRDAISLDTPDGTLPLRRSWRTGRTNKRCSRCRCASRSSAIRSTTFRIGCMG